MNEEAERQAALLAEQERALTEEAKQRTEIIKEQERVANDLRLRAIQRFKDEASECMSIPAKLKNDNDFFYKCYQLQLGTNEFLLVPRDGRQLEILVSPKSGDKVEMLSRFWSMNENVLINLVDERSLSIELKWSSHKILSAWLEKRQNMP